MNSTLDSIGKKKWHDGPLSVDGSMSPRAMEEYNYLRQSLVGLMPEGQQKTLLFASATEEEGSSNVVAHFAIALASTGERVLLVDGNLRNPALHQVFVVEKSPGMAEFLSRQKTLEQVTKPTRFPRLSLVTAGDCPQNPFSLLENGETGSLLQGMKAAADWILIDAPAINTFNDAVILGPKTDGVVLVVRAEKTRWEVAGNACERLESSKASILGVVLNGRKLHIPEWIYKRL